MSRIVELLCSRRVPHVAVLALMSFGFAGCSADMQTRLSQNPFASQPEATGSVPPAAVERREPPQYSRPQPQYQSQALPPPIAAPQSYPPAGGGVSGGGRGLASYAPTPPRPIETTGTVAPRSVAAARAPGRAGTTIIVGTSDTVDILARRYHVTPAAIMQANGYKGPRVLSPGQQLIIPHESAVAVAVAAPAASPALAPPVAVAPASRAVAAASAPPAVHFVNRGDTLLSIARHNHIPVAELARANGLDPQAKLKLGTRLTVPGAKTAAVAPVAQPAAVAIAQPAVALAPPATKLAAVTAGPPQTARLAQATTKVEEPSAESPVKAAEATGALPTFRWPVRGKVITSYGAKTNGKSNDGINLAVPEGTPVKAAEDGIVAYSGNELKGYGNLVLVRHANGYVTAYAHASELLVKRGDTIKRGQVIAKSGQSGEVGSPQLHFEIRKGSTPVDPLQFLNGA
ncbi:LysM peptidoglycan-binding domain-containing M23 family metallopeptidase [Bradyrhizobium erythrophlei]|uniref:Murein DD-endopeptidase MepM and murein hydrolase activator NlpD, contain LysM domain n=1 Tax=Bradyrhizobium erythrophlei TaxID=1437360 RepID=A0A1M5RVK2_9BRAD|nr:LysM peptidoglycan-binding domain-containing M23 family metallopeptidase [Bradyrhizobium erythrophlei]SHH30347.1 Murein DD-endopeptidase MepM and murein hydrolase activator NlpD, contain LysM domain [Bradyrhizobium erythrophlei]